MANIKLGISLFSFTREYVTGELDLDGCIRTAREMGVDGIELVGTQMLESYPYATGRVAGEFAAMCRNYGVKPVCYGANTDRGMLHDRDLTEDEMVAMAITDIKTAYELGFHILRCQFLLGTNGMRRLAPYAEYYGVKVGLEIHNPETPSSPVVQGYLDMIQEAGSPWLGLIPDFGCFATKPNKPHWDNALAGGAPVELLELAEKLRRDGVALETAMDTLRKAGAPDTVMAAASGMYGYVTFYNEPDIRGLERILPYCIHFHGKFHHMGPDLKEASIPYEAILPPIMNAGYDGYIVSECEYRGADSQQMLRRHLEMERRLLAGGPAATAG